jgi:hypothetical protein
MNAFVEHHQNSIQFGYRCFDRLLLNGLIQPFQPPERVLGFFNTYRDGKRVTRRVLREIADQFQNWLKNRSEKWGAPVVDAPEDKRRDDFVLPYLNNCASDRVAVILKAREPARILVAIGGEKNDSPHLEFKQRWVNQFNFYVNDQPWGRMFVRVCPYFPFSARVCLNQYHWLAIRMRQEGIDFQQCSNAFLKCGHPAPAGTCRFADAAGLIAMRPEVVGRIHPLPFRSGAQAGWLSAPSVLLASGIL